MARRMRGGSHPHYRMAAAVVVKLRERWLDVLVLGVYCLALIAIYTQERSNNAARIADTRALVMQHEQARREGQAFLLRFVCDSIALRLEQDGPSAGEFAARFAVIMREHDARCSPPVKGLP